MCVPADSGRGKIIQNTKHEKRTKKERKKNEKRTKKERKKNEKRRSDL
jgi:hypothetical protein